MKLWNKLIEYKICQIYAIIKNTEVILVHGNLPINVYQDDLYIVISNESFGQLSEISPSKFTFLKTFNSEFLYVD